jgi:hypothetical protein
MAGLYTENGLLHAANSLKTKSAAAFSMPRRRDFVPYEAC